ncbi:hypothetical protein GCW_91912 [Mycoplasmoides gallisepticum S6]|uniref:Uncharacterized protein n=1 Tax=Mycoplasmoides gallisepticum S6 TaxID=1006581 RepID=A0A0F6CLX9_MYCGL|nr:hypothetical protein GCW_91912 [Mycoplasmoides gallisepticum S6]
MIPADDANKPVLQNLQTLTQSLGDSTNEEALMMQKASADQLVSGFDKYALTKELKNGFSYKPKSLVINAYLFLFLVNLLKYKYILIFYE